MLNRFQQREGKNRTPLKSIADRLSTFQKEVNEGSRAEVAALEHREAETTEPKRRDKFLRIAVPRSQRTSSRVAFIAFRRRESTSETRKQVSSEFSFRNDLILSA